MARLFRDGRKVNMGGLCYPYVSGFWDWGLIRFFGNGCLGFRPDGGSLLKSPEAGPVKSKQNAFAPPLGASPRLGILAGLPTAQYLRSASVVNGAPEINVHREAA